jgi:2-keto-4-pentenoate hydratase
MSTPAAEEVVAAELVAARREGRSLTRFPGVVPASMAEAYQIQELVMSRWQDSLVGWKIGHIPADRRTAGDPDRLVGPIWRQQYHLSEEQVSAAEVGIFASGFAAVEAELVIRLGQDLPAHDGAAGLPKRRRTWSSICWSASRSPAARSLKSTRSARQ